MSISSVEKCKQLISDAREFDGVVEFKTKTYKNSLCFGKIVNQTNITEDEFLELVAKGIGKPMYDTGYIPHKKGCGLSNLVTFIIFDGDEKLYEKEIKNATGSCLIDRITQEDRERVRNAFVLSFIITIGIAIFSNVIFHALGWM